MRLSTVSIPLRRDRNTAISGLAFSGMLTSGDNAVEINMPRAREMRRVYSYAHDSSVGGNSQFSYQSWALAAMKR